LYVAQSDVCGNHNSVGAFTTNSDMIASDLLTSSLMEQFLIKLSLSLSLTHSLTLTLT